MRKIGLFIGGVCVIKYPDDPAFYMEAIDDLKKAVQESGVFHELKCFDE